MGKYSSVIFLALAIVIGLSTSFLTYDWLKKRTGVQEAVAAVETETIVVAATDLERGTKIVKETLKIVEILKGSIPADKFFSDAAEAEGRVLLQPVYAGEPVLISRCAPEGVTAGGVGALIKPNKRAMTVKVDKVKGVSGFVNPGNLVDVLVTLEQPGKGRNPITKTVLENIVVLASGTSLEHRGDKKDPVEVDVITLEVDPEEGEKLALASTHGMIQLAMRNHMDSADVMTEGTTIETLLASYKNPTKPVKKSVKRAAPKRQVYQPHRVEVIKGSDVSNIKF